LTSECSAPPGPRRPSPSVSVGLTYGYSRYNPASREVKHSTKMIGNISYLSAYGATPPEGRRTQRPTLQGSQRRVRGVRHCCDNCFSSTPSGSGAGESFRGRCPRLLCESPSGFLNVSSTPGVQQKIWDMLSPRGEGYSFASNPRARRAPAWPEPQCGRFAGTSQTIRWSANDKRGGQESSGRGPESAGYRTGSESCADEARPEA